MIFSIIVSCKNDNEPKPVSPKINSENSSVNSEIINIEVKTFEIDGGWGYDIYVNNEKYIHQEHIPAVNGLFTFKSSSDANKVADLMVQKIQNKIIPPTISIEELNSLGIKME